MKSELKQRWVDALRSGKYPQTTCGLENSKGFCCLGVACAIFAEDVGLRIKHPEIADNWTTYDGVTDILPKKLQEFLELSENGVLPTEVVTKKFGVHRSLMSLNDDANLTFDQIADVIDAQF